MEKELKGQRRHVLVDAPKVTEAEWEKEENGKRKRRKKTHWELQVPDLAVGQCRDLVLSFPIYQIRRNYCHMPVLL